MEAAQTTGVAFCGKCDRHAGAAFHGGWRASQGPQPSRPVLALGRVLRVAACIVSVENPRFTGFLPSRRAFSMLPDVLLDARPRTPTRPGWRSLAWRERR